MEMTNLLVVEEITIGLLLVAVLVGLASRWVRVPYTLGLVLVGLVLALIGRVEIELTPDLILALLVPPLVFEAAFHIRFADLRRDWGAILALAVPGVVLTTLVVGGVLHYLAGLPMELALLFGALVSATDPVAVVALFRALGAPKRLQVLLEGESLFNDGTAIVVFHLVLAVVMSGHFALAESLVEFVRVAGGGLLIGALAAMLVAQIIARMDDYLLETAITVVLAYGAYLLAESAHVSGVLSVVAAGLLLGNLGPRGMSPTTRIVVLNFWELAAFFANTFVFLLIGLQVNMPALLANGALIGWAIVAVLVSRLLDVYGLGWLAQGAPFRWLHVLFWGGLRGAISLALAVGLPGLIGEQGEQLRVMAFGVVLFTLLVQGSTIGWLVRRLNIVGEDVERQAYEEMHARAVAARMAYEHLARLYAQGLLSHHTWQLLRPVLQARSHRLQEELQRLFLRNPALGLRELKNARLEALRAQRTAVMELFQAGVISEETYHALAAEVDHALAEEVPAWPGMLLRRSPEEPPVRSMMLAVVQEQDAPKAGEALARLAVPVTAFPSVGGFLGRRNVTLMIGVPEGQLDDIVTALKESCKRRVEFVARPLLQAGLPLPAPQQVTVGGATVFLFPVEHYEEL